MDDPPIELENEESRTPAEVLQTLSSRWDDGGATDLPNLVIEDPELDIGDQENVPVSSPSPGASPRVPSPAGYPPSPECPPTPEHVPPGSRTPPPSTSQARGEFDNKRHKRRSKSLDGAGGSTPESEPCPICLGKLDNKSMTDTCLHKFCFTCLLEWSKVKAECPLCKGRFSAIFHNVRSDDDYDRYDLPPAEPRPEASLQDFLYSTRRFRYHTTMNSDRLERRRDAIGNQVARMADNLRQITGRHNWTGYRSRRGPGTSDFRREVYTRDQWSQPLSDITNRFRECSPEWYRTNEAQTHRLIPWLNRELNVLLELSSQQGRAAHLMTQIVDWVKLYNIDSPDMRDQLLPYLGTNTEHFQHEFHNFARTPYDMVGYDRNVIYTTRSLPPAQVVSSDSSSEEGEGVGTFNEDTQFLDQMRNRFQDAQSNLSRLFGERMATHPGFVAGLVTRYPDRSSRTETESSSGRDGGEERRRSRSRERDRKSRERSKRREPEGYRREMDRLWGIRSRLDGSNDRNRRRKSKRPARFPEAAQNEVEDEAGLLISPIDLSMRDQQASTSRGEEGCGLTRLVIPDTDSGDDIVNEENLVKEADKELSDQGSPQPEVTVADAVTTSLNLVMKSDKRENDVQTTGGSSTADNYIPLASSSHPGYYTDVFTNPNYMLSSHALQMLDPLTGLLQAPTDLSTSNNKKPPPPVDDDDNSDLEVVDVVKARPARKAAEPEVVELSDSDQSPSPPRYFNHDEPVVISSDDDETSNNKKKSIPPPAESSSEDDLIVVKTEHNTIDPITKKQIEDPVRNKKCNHIYEKSTIYQMIDIARQNSKSVKCPYMGCNQKDFKKTDLAKDKEVLGHLNKVREEKAIEEMEKIEKDLKKLEERKKAREEANNSEVSADSIVEEAIEIMKQDILGKEEGIPLPDVSAPALSESSTSSDVSTSEDSTSKSEAVNSSKSSKSSSEEPISSMSKYANKDKCEDSESVKEPEKSKQSKHSSPRPVKNSKRRRVFYSSDSDEDGVEGDTDSDVPLSTARNNTKRKRKPPSKLNDSYSGSEFDESDHDEHLESDVRNRVKKSKSNKRVKIVGKKVTETWSIEKEKIPSGKSSKKRKPKDSTRGTASIHDFSESDEEDIPISRKGKSSSKRPPKNKFSKEPERPRRAQKVSYAESDDDIMF